MTTPTPRRQVPQPPPPFVESKVVDIEPRTPRMTMVTVEGPGLGALVPDEPAASVRLLLPRGHAADELEMPNHDGNVFRYTDGELSTARTMTPLSADHPDRMLLGVHDHGGGRLSRWLSEVAVGNAVALSGPGAAYTIDTDADRYLIAGDESALPAIGQLLDAMPTDMPVDVCVEITTPKAQIELPERATVSVAWRELPAGDEPTSTLVSWTAEQTITPGTRLWVAGEAAGVHKIRKLVDLPRRQANIRGYWKKRA